MKANMNVFWSTKAQIIHHWQISTKRKHKKCSTGRRKMITDDNTEMQEGMKNNGKSKYEVHKNEYWLCKASIS